MPIELIAIRITVGLILFTAGWAKARDPNGFAKVVKSMGTPDVAVAPTAKALPWIEMATAAALLWPSLAPTAAILAAGLLGVFSTVVAVALARGDAPECGCFGKLATSKASWRLVGRNLVLIALLMPVAFPMGG